MFKTVLAAFFLLIPGMVCALTTKVEPAPRPDWVIVHELSEPLPERRELLENGVYFLLHDLQIRWNGARDVHFQRIAYRITERAGLEDGSSISREFDPSFQTLRLHGARIRRDGEVIDLTRDLEITLIRRETELDSGILDGDLTAHMYLPSVEVGDIVDLEFSWISQPHIGRDHFSTAFEPNYSVPVGAMHYRVLYPQDRELSVRTTETDLAQAAVTRDGWSELRWEQRDPEPLVSENSVPSWHRPWGLVDVSSVPGWSSVVEAFLPHYPSDVPLPPKFAARIDAIAEETPSRRLRLARMLRIVQDEIRYVGIEIGPGALVARPPEVTLRKGYGDCKDKSVLLAAALRRLGIDAVPALTHLTRGKELPRRLPSFNVFDHMIVRAEIDGSVFWLDPTAVYQGGVGSGIVAPLTGHALPLRPGQTDLEAIPHVTSRMPTIDVTEVFTFGGQGNPVELKVTSVRRSFSADWMRRELAAKSRRALSRAYHRYYTEYYPGIRQIGPLEIADDRDGNRVVVTENYQLDWAELIRDGLNQRFPLRGGTLVDVLKDPSTAQRRRTPLWQPYPTHVRHKVVVKNTPAHYEPPDRVTFANAYYHFIGRNYSIPTEFSATWTLKTRTDSVNALDVAEYVAGVGEMEHQLT